MRQRKDEEVDVVFFSKMKVGDGKTYTLSLRKRLVAANALN